MNQPHKLIPAIAGRRAGFTLVETVLAVAVVVVGVTAILGLLPAGMRATRSGTDDMQMALIGQDYIAYYQQLALSGANYNYPSVLGTGSFTTNSVCETVTYTVHVTIADTGFAQMTVAGSNLLSRVTIDIWRPGTRTNTYVTEVARYVLP